MDRSESGYRGIRIGEWEAAAGTEQRYELDANGTGTLSCIVGLSGSRGKWRKLD
jgi:hypothetical protein